VRSILWSAVVRDTADFTSLESAQKLTRDERRSELQLITSDYVATVAREIPRRQKTPYAYLVAGPLLRQTAKGEQSPAPRACHQRASTPTAVEGGTRARVSTRSRRALGAR